MASKVCFANSKGAGGALSGRVYASQVLIKMLIDIMQMSFGAGTLRGLMFALLASIQCAVWGGPASGVSASPPAGDQARLSDEWVYQRAKTDLYRFRLKITHEEGDRVVVHDIEVLDARSNARRQLISVEGGGVVSTSTDKLLTVVDANFDGYPDISVMAADGGAGPNVTDFFYIYHPQQKDFVIDDELSSMTQVSINPNGTITSSFRDGCCSHGNSTYRYLDNKLTLIESLEESLSLDGLWIETTRGVLKDGRIAYTTTRKKAPAERRLFNISRLR